MMLQWAGTFANGTRLAVERSTNGGEGWSVVARTYASLTQYFGGSLSTSKTYWYRVRAYNSAGYSDYSNMIAVAYVNGVWRVSAPA